MLCEVVREQLIKKGIKQSELVRRTGINKSVISSLKNGEINKPSFELVCKIADALEVSLDELRKEEPNV